ncbi:tetratricopeptide repeat-containing sensor histidine kinase [Ignavibacterium album]|uniref:tetratricopeptide repeat-containing sensor histidine kinase n=1 Tax=Ignavibacterium album TaxID=591197 RepID=UPI00143CAD4D|nr:tetratricopeptide repeat-containing sensor histidine kinase [Ignavibacterium album]
MIDSINSISYQDIVSNLQKYHIIFNDNLRKARESGYQKGIAKSLSNLALVHYLKGDYDESIKYHLEAIELFQKLQMFFELSEEYAEMGYQLKRQNLNRALEFMQKAISIAEENNLPSFRISKIYDNYGVLKEMKQQYDSAFYFYHKALKIKEELKDSIGIPYSLNKIAVLYANLGQFDKAYYYLNKSDLIRAKEQGEFGRIENLSLHADFLSYQNKINGAIKKFEEVFNAAKKINYTYLVLYSLKNLSELYKKKGDYQNALSSYQSYSSLKDSIDNVDIKTRIAQLEIAYETEQKNKLLAESQYQLRSKEQQLFFAIVTVILLLMIFIGVYKFLQLKKKRDIAEVEYKSKLRAAMLEKKISDEKLKLSRELHDNIGSQLTFIISSLENIIYKIPEANFSKALNPIKEFSRSALDDLRNTIWAIKHQEGNLEELSLKVNEFVSRINNSIGAVVIENEFEINKNYSLNSTQMLNLFRIIQEAIQNAVKHSDADKIKINFISNDYGFKVIIKDNGNGFDVVNSSKGSGLCNMQHRCEESGGKFSITSSSAGTEIVCDYQNV